MLRDDQVLLRGDELYLCAPRGQLVEGYLAIAPYQCVGCVAVMPANWMGELCRMADLVADFYREVYGVAQPVFYEQGRAGAGSDAADVAGFPLHAHVCCLPVAADVHGLLDENYLQKPLAGPSELAGATGSHPYVYVDSVGKRFVYLPRCEEGRLELERMRLKPAIAELLGFPERGYWRDYPGDPEVQRVIKRFGAFRESRMT